MIDPISLFVTAIGTAVGKAGAAEGQRLVRQLVGLQEEQVKLLKVIDAKVDALIQGPFQAGRLHLDDALAVWRDPHDRVHLLREARSSFTQALAQDRDEVRASLAALHLSVVWIALESPEDVRRALRVAHVHAMAGILPAMGPGSQDLRSLFNADFGQRERHERGAVVANYANTVAHTCRAWGSTMIEAPVFTGEGQNANSSYTYWATLINERPGVSGDMVQVFPHVRVRGGRLTNHGDLYAWAYAMMQGQ